MTERIKKLYGGLTLSYKDVIIFAVITGVVTGIIMIIPFLEGTSLENIGICLEAWIILAMIIIMNAKNPTEAAVKTFLFFLISQPIIYLVQVPFSWVHWGIFMYYPKWFVLTLLTFPGGYLAWFVKKDNLLSAIILSFATALLCSEGIYHVEILLEKFPRQLITSFTCFAVAIIFIQTFISSIKNKSVAYVITILATFLISYLNII